MKSTGIIRRIDDLGRVVIPKEIRKNLGFQTEDPIEIFVEGEKVILRKYFSAGKFAEQAREYVRSFEDIAGVYVFVTDTEKVIATTLHGFCGAPLSKELIDAIRNKEDVENIPAGCGTKNAVVEYATTIMDGRRNGMGEGIGAVVLVKDTTSVMNETVKIQMQIAADFLGRLANADGGC